VNGFFNELKRRKVYRVAVGYVVVAGGIIQLASAVFPAWELPGWSLRLVIVLLLAGFPIALIFAWAFDVTPAGIQATPRLQPNERGRVTARYRPRNIFLLAAFGLAVAIAAGFFVLPRVAAKKVDKSIAVLPFENFSDQKSNAFFADGIQDDILTTLAKISDLKVISRTSVMAYRGSSRNVREIGKALGAAAILEGSVRSDGKRVRVNVQLINAANDEHIWANEYDRDLTDVFAIQTDLAHEIANALQAKLSPAEKAQMEKKPTQNANAYLLYVQAHDFFTRPDMLASDLRKAEELFQGAIQLDPDFALAYAQLSHVESWMFHSVDSVPERRAKARAAANEALRLQPDLPEAHVALGYCYYYGDRDYERALAEFALAQRGLPNDAENFKAIGAIQRRQGKWSQSTANFEKAAALNPKDADLLLNLAYNYLALRHYEEAEKVIDRGLKAAPKSLALNALKCQIAITARGDTGVAERAFASLPAGFDPDGMVSFGRVNIWLLQRKYSDALQLVQQFPGDTFHTEGTVSSPKALVEGLIYHFMQDEEKARASFARARPQVEQTVRESPEDPSRHLLLAQLLAGLGEKEAAIAEAKRAAELLPESRDAFDGPMITVSLAQIYAWVGETGPAFELLEHSLVTPNGVTVALLKLDPMWDPLRNNPRFDQLIAKHGGSP
jgi:TolB-like protein/Tfp pilus assembly protein PilF